MRLAAVQPAAQLNTSASGPQYESSSAKNIKRKADLVSRMEGARQNYASNPCCNPGRHSCSWSCTLRPSCRPLAICVCTSLLFGYIWTDTNSRSSARLAGRTRKTMGEKRVSRRGGVLEKEKGLVKTGPLVCLTPRSRKKGHPQTSRPSASNGSIPATLQTLLI